MTERGETVICIRDLIKEFDIGLRGIRLRAVDRLSLDIPKGVVFGLLGPNGSGKSTTIKIVLGLMRATAGSCSVLGQPAGDRGSRARIGYLPESPDFYRYLTGSELVGFYGRIGGLRGTALQDRCDRVLELVGLREAGGRRIGTYSKGMLQRVGLAQALVHDPDLVILDEPTAGVDPIGARLIAEIIGRLKTAGKTIVLSSHLLAQVEGVCDRVAILNRGRVILEGRVEDLLREKDLRMAVFDSLPAGEEAALATWLRERGANNVSIGHPRTTLDRIFVEEIEKSSGKGEAT